MFERTSIDVLASRQRLQQLNFKTLCANSDRLLADALTKGRVPDDLNGAKETARWREVCDEKSLSAKMSTVLVFQRSGAEGSHCVRVLRHPRTPVFSCSRRAFFSPYPWRSHSVVLVLLCLWPLTESQLSSLSSTWSKLRLLALRKCFFSRALSTFPETCDVCSA